MWKSAGEGARTREWMEVEMDEIPLNVGVEFSAGVAWPSGDQREGWESEILKSCNLRLE